MLKTEINLENDFTIESMHDQCINRIEMDNDRIILHYDELYYSKVYHQYHVCKIVFSGIEEGALIAEIRNKKGIIIQARRYYDREFLSFLEKYHYKIETIMFFGGYRTIIIQAALVDETGIYADECIIKITAKEMLYQWG